MSKFRFSINRFSLNDRKISRSAACLMLGLTLLLAGSSLATADEQDADQPVDLKIAYDKTKVYRVEYLIEHLGEVRVEYVKEEEKNQILPIDVKSRLEFHERFLGTPENPQSVRRYERATADITLNEKELGNDLEPENRLIVTRIKSDAGNKYQIASVGGILAQKELELLKNPADPLVYSELFTKTNVRPGESWEPARDSLARLLFVDYVTQSDVKIELKEVRGQFAKVHIVGRVRAAVDDTMTDIALAGIAQLDLQEGMVVGLRMNLDENRLSAQIAPGYSGRSKIDVRISPSNPLPELEPENLRQLAKSRAIRNQLRWLADNKAFQLIYEPSWKLISADTDAAIFRFVENGDLLTQCNVVRLSSRPPDNPLVLSDFQREVAKAIAKDPNSRIVTADQGINAHGHQVLRVLVRGVEEEVSVNWIYYNVASEDGQQVTFIFTAEEQVLNRVLLPSQQLVDGFVFFPRNFGNPEFGNLEFGNTESESPTVRGAGTEFNVR